MVQNPLPEIAFDEQLLALSSSFSEISLDIFTKNKLIVIKKL